MRIFPPALPRTYRQIKLVSLLEHDAIPNAPVTQGFFGQKRDTVGIYGPSAKEPNRTVLDLVYRQPTGRRKF